MYYGIVSKQHADVWPETHGPLHGLGTGDGSQLKQWSPGYEQQARTTHPTSLCVEILEYVFMKRLCCLSCNVSNNIW